LSVAELVGGNDDFVGFANISLVPVVTVADQAVDVLWFILDFPLLSGI